jgi:endonuclease/exonuclease/phosphatase family metal-dependent hydrolase
MALRVRTATFNIRLGVVDDGPNSWEHRQGAVIEAVRSLDLDILAVQEAHDFQLSALRLGLRGMKDYAVGREDGRSLGEHAAIFWRDSALEPSDAGTFWLSELPEEPGSISWGAGCTRVCSWVRLRHRREGGEITFANTHWDHLSEEARLRSAELTVERLGRAENLVLAGDYNAELGEASLACLTHSGLRHLAPEPPDGTYHGFSGKPDQGAIDHIFGSAGIRCSGQGIDMRISGGRFPSDHFAVWAVIEV